MLLPYLTLSQSPQYGSLCVDADSNIFLASITALLLSLSLLLSSKCPFHPPHSTLYLSTLSHPLPSVHFSVSSCHHISLPPHPALSPHPPHFWFIFTSYHSPLSPLPSLLPTATQMDRKGVGPSMPANRSDPPQGGASLHYGYIRMNVCC